MVNLRCCERLEQSGTEWEMKRETKREIVRSDEIEKRGDREARR